MISLLLSITIIFCASFSITTAENNATFPISFKFGVVTSAYQVEGGWNEDGKGENIWDHWVHDKQSPVENNETGDVTSDFYHHYKEDISNACVYMAATHFRFSISWSRLFPNGFDDDINVNGILYYQSMIDEIRSFGMTPIATLYHHDLPQPLQDIGGWTNPEMVNYFVNYARIVFKYFDKVKYWITFDDPRSTCRLGYGEGVHPPGISLDGIGEYLCTYVLVKSHAAVYHMYKEDFPDLKAPLSISIDLPWSEPASNTTADVEAAERRNMFEFGLYAHPIFKGNWPQVVIDRVGSRSKNEKLQKSRLPEFTQEEIEYIKGTYDYMAVNIYHTNLVADVAEPEYGDPGYMKDMRTEISVNPDWDVAPDGKPIVPWGATKSLKWVKDTFNDPNIYIAGNGIPDDGTSLEDDNRISFYRQYLSAILDAMYEDNVKVFAYAAKGLIDSFEWNEGYKQHYGFYHVNFTDVNRKRTRKKSVRFYEDLSNSHRIPQEIITSSTTTTTSTTGTTPTTTTEPSTTTDSAARIMLYPAILFTSLFFYLLY